MVSALWPSNQCKQAKQGVQRRWTLKWLLENSFHRVMEDEKERKLALKVVAGYSTGPSTPTLVADSDKRFNLV